MNGYKNPETFHLSLWMHNDEVLNNHLLPELLNGSRDITIAANKLKLLFVGNTSIIENHLQDNYKIMLEDVGDFSTIAWEELFTNCEG